jgi:hypothetical protein
MPTGGRPGVRAASIAGAGVALVLLGLTPRSAHAANDDGEGAAPEAVPSGDSASDAQDRGSGSSRTAGPQNRVSLSLGAAYAVRRLYGVSMNGGGVEAVLGGNFGNITVAADIEGVSGSTEYGLAMNTFSVGPLLEIDVDRFRIGAGARLGVLVVDRVTTSDSLVGSTTGMFVRGAVDVLRFASDRDAVYLVAKASMDSVGGALYGASLGAGVRF